VTAAAQLQARPPPSRNPVPHRSLTGTPPGPDAGDSRRRMRQAIVLDSFSGRAAPG
jgi:hypothetical protein